MIPLYFTFFYTKDEMGLRMAIWFGFAAVAGAFGGSFFFIAISKTRLINYYSGLIGMTFSNGWLFYNA